MGWSIAPYSWMMRLMVDAMVRGPVKLFCCYHSRDADHYAKFRTHLHLLIASGKLQVGGVGEIEPGADMRKAGMSEVGSADIVVFLMSAELIADKSHAELMKAAHARAETKECAVIPVLLRAAMISSTCLGSLKPLPSDGQNIHGRSDEDSVWLNIVQEMQPLVDAVLPRVSAPLLPSPETDPRRPQPIKPSVRPSPRPNPAQREMRSRVDQLLRATPAVQQELATWLLTKRNNDEDTDAPEPDADAIVASLFDEGWSAEDLADSLRYCIEARGMTDSDRVVVQEVARLVLPQSKEVRERLHDWRKQLAGRILVLPYGTHAKAEAALSRLGDRPYREQLRASRGPTSPKPITELTSEAMFPVSQIRSGSALAVLSSRTLIEEIARYFASNVYLGPRRLEEKKLLAEDPRYSNLDFTKEGDLDILLGALNDKLRFHASARDDDLLPMHIEIDDDTLSARLTDANDALLRDLREAFPRLSFVRLNKKAGDDNYFVDCLLKIFHPVRKASA